MRLGAGYSIRAQFKLTTAVKSIAVKLSFGGEAYIGSTSSFSAGITATRSSSKPSADTTFLFSKLAYPAEASFDINKSLSPGTYYLWIWTTGSSAGSWTYGYYKTHFSLKITGVQQTYTVSLPEGDGYIASGETGKIAAGSDYSFSVTTLLPYVAGPDFSVTANGKALSPGDAGEYVIKNISANQTVRVSGVIIGGIVRIANGDGFDDYLVYIANGSKWEQYLPYISDGTTFNLHS